MQPLIKKSEPEAAPEASLWFIKGLQRWGGGKKSNPTNSRRSCIEATFVPTVRNALRAQNH